MDITMGATGGGSGGTGGAGMNDGGTGGVGQGPQFTMVNTPDQTLVQSSPFLVTTAKVDIAQVVNNFAGLQNVDPGQVSLPSNTMDEGLSCMTLIWTNFQES
ncbi:hypothetical protein MSAN_01993000 [Mycena sanguinolenta]|uniref:Uncharacterized protein n=1 Tax=Mycena sanguinolenta TaxID=230812 RepID=A0A8H7CNR4_9AGAR|nr:hypothetical protein MSAN_01993000 [Mycena sanguinolenta]